MSDRDSAVDPAARTALTDLTEEEWREWQRLAAAVRNLSTGSVGMNAPLEAMTALADQAEALAERLAPHVDERPLSHFSENPPARPLQGDELDQMLPFSPITGRLNPVSPPIRMSGDTERVVGTVSLTHHHQGAPGFAHGAVVAGIWDEVLAFATVTHGLVGPTALLSIKYRRPTRLYIDLRYESWLERSDGKRIFAKGRCYDDANELVSEAEAMFVRIDPETPHPDWEHVRRTSPELPES